MSSGPESGPLGKPKIEVGVSPEIVTLMLIMFLKQVWS